MTYTRRDFGKIALAGLPAAGFLLDPAAAFGSLLQGKPNSKWAGVQVGMNVPYNFKTGNYMTADDIIARCQQLGVSGMELRAQPVELFLGSPAAVAAAAAGANRGRGRDVAGDGRAPATRRLRRHRRRGRTGTGRRRRARRSRRRPGRADARTAGRSAGGGGGNTQVAQRAYPSTRSRNSAASSTTRGLASRSSSGMASSACRTTRSITASRCPRPLAPPRYRPRSRSRTRSGSDTFADKHKMPIGYHGHATTSAADFETVLSYAKYNAVNLDLGHFTAGQNESPVPFLKKHHERITHVHVKDRKLNNGPNVPLGQGDTPIKEALQLMRDNKWRVPGDPRVRVSDPRGFRPEHGARQVHAVLQGVPARVSFRVRPEESEGDGGQSRWTREVEFRTRPVSSERHSRRRAIVGAEVRASTVVREAPDEPVRCRQQSDPALRVAGSELNDDGKGPVRSAPTPRRTAGSAAGRPLSPSRRDVRSRWRRVRRSETTLPSIEVSPAACPTSNAPLQTGLRSGDHSRLHHPRHKSAHAGL